MITRATSGGSSARTSTPPTLTTPQIASLIAQSVARADAYRVSVLGQTTALLKGTVKALNLEQTRLTAMYGADSPQVAAVSRRLGLQNTMLQITTANLQRAQTPVPTPPQGGAAIFGRVIDASGAGIAGLTVSALDAQDAVLARSVTDDNGAFTLSLSATRASARKASETESAAAFSYRLRVTDKEQNVRYADKHPSVVATGRLTHREIPTTHPQSKTAGPAPRSGSGAARKRATARRRRPK